MTAGIESPPDDVKTVEGKELSSRLEFLTRAMKTPAIRANFAQLADRARADGWSHEQYLAVLLERQVAVRESNGTVLRIRAAKFPTEKTIEEFNFDYVPGLRRDIVAHLATCTWIPKADNVILLGPPGVGKTHLAIALGVKAAHNGYPVIFDTASGWANRLTEAHRVGRFEDELRKLKRYRVLIIDEIGYLPFDSDTASLFFRRFRLLRGSNLGLTGDQRQDLRYARHRVVPPSVGNRDSVEGGAGRAVSNRRAGGRVG
jgi:DNA replication protein DnaC